MFNKNLVLMLSMILALAACTAINGSRQKGKNRNTSQSSHRDVRIVFVSARDGNLEVYSMDPDGVSQKRLTSSESPAIPYACTPDGTKILFISNSDGGFFADELYIMNSDGSDKKRLTRDSDNWEPSLSDDGKRIVFTHKGSIYTMNIDGTGMKKITGPKCSKPAWSPDGMSIVYVKKHGGFHRDVYIINADGFGERRLTELGEVINPTWSHSGQKIAFYGTEGNLFSSNLDIYVMNADGSELKQLTNHPAWDRDPQWSPSDDRIAFTSNRDGKQEIYTMRPDGSDLLRLTNNNRSDYDQTWSPDGKRIVFVAQIDEDNDEIYIMDADGSNEKRLTTSDFEDSSPTWCGKCRKATVGPSLQRTQAGTVIDEEEKSELTMAEVDEQPKEIQQPIHSVEDTRGPDTRFYLAKAAYDLGDYHNAFPTLLAVAETGHPEAQFYVGIMYVEGRGVEQDEREEAR